MLRLVGAGLILAGAGYVGWRASRDLSDRTRQIQELMDALKALERELTFRLAPLPELLFSVGNGISGPLRMFFLRCSEYARTGDGRFIEHWDREAERLKDRLDADPMDCLLRLGRGIGRYHWEEVRALIASQTRELEMYLQKARQEELRKGQIYRALSVTAGACLVILLV